MAPEPTQELTIKAKADLEAAAAEAETPAEPEPDEPADDDADDTDPEHAEPEPEPEPAGRKGKSPQAQFEAAFDRFRAAAAKIFEVPVGEVEAVPYPGVVGIMLPGFAAPRTHDNYVACATCNGLGKVLTGANTNDPSKDWHVCPDTRCKGNGFWAKNNAVTSAPATGPLAVVPGSVTDGEYAEAPAWMGDPNLSATG